MPNGHKSQIAENANIKLGIEKKINTILDMFVDSEIFF